eukprot:CAMPEP_0168783932 /NCGR_PEP_ID=MMETSP0725-20121227/9953_1 /TAXON_ID=265536 /ORGANISM="Amphiprora sp., Strain CCMP467" /LENGTH=243 /DNA_ID=CAMNT_0008833949 /DNA_START=166 /DNA_END=895 /DNA_ORIENTATION=-
MANAPYRRKNFAMESRNNGNGDDPQSTYYYSDDCFGLIFLSTGLVAGDVVFASCFALISAVAATYFNKNAKELNAKLQKQFPGAVAGLTLLFVAPVTRVVLQPNSLDFLPERAPFATILEIGVCALSVVYSLVATQQEKEADRQYCSYARTKGVYRSFAITKGVALSIINELEGLILWIRIDLVQSLPMATFQLETLSRMFHTHRALCHEEKLRSATKKGPGGTEEKLNYITTKRKYRNDSSR